MKKQNIEKSIKNAVTHLTPDVLDDILLKCDDQQNNVYIMQTEAKKRYFPRVAGALAAALVLVFGAVFIYNAMSNNQVNALVTLDVNPSVEIRINNDDRVVDVEAKNEDAVKILDNMDLKNTTIDVTVNAIIGSMLKQGYIRENANSVLLSVESEDGEKSAALQKSLTLSISQQINMVNGAVISQSLASNDEMKKLAKEHQISYGKAVFIQWIISENKHLSFEELAKLSVNELCLLFNSKSVSAEGIETEGKASDTDYIGEEKARKIALDHAGVKESEVTELESELDYDDGIMIYEIEFKYKNNDYEFEINAKDGSIIEYKHDDDIDEDEKKTETKSNVNNDDKQVDKKVDTKDNKKVEKKTETKNDKKAETKENKNYKQESKVEATNPPNSSTSFIGEKRAREIAQSHAGVNSYTDFKIDLDEDDDIYIYEIEFSVGDLDYEYEINATTGEILYWEVDD